MVRRDVDIFTGEGITKQNIDKITVGMTLEQVEEILGCPPGLFFTGTTRKIRLQKKKMIGSTIKTWRGDAGQAEVEFSHKARGEALIVVSKYWNTLPDYLPSDNMNDRLIHLEFDETKNERMK